MEPCIPVMVGANLYRDISRYFPQYLHLYAEVRPMPDLPKPPKFVLAHDSSWPHESRQVRRRRIRALRKGKSA